MRTGPLRAQRSARGHTAWRAKHNSSEVPSGSKVRLPEAVTPRPQAATCCAAAHLRLILKFRPNEMTTAFEFTP